MRGLSTCVMSRSWGACLDSTGWCLRLAPLLATWPRAGFWTMEDAIHPTKPWPHRGLQTCLPSLLGQSAQPTARTFASKASTTPTAFNVLPRRAFRATAEISLLRKANLNAPSAPLVATLLFRAHGHLVRRANGANFPRCMALLPAPCVAQANLHRIPG